MAANPHFDMIYPTNTPMIGGPINPSDMPENTVPMAGPYIMNIDPNAVSTPELTRRNEPPRIGPSIGYS